MFQERQLRGRDCRPKALHAQLSHKRFTI